MMELATTFFHPSTEILKNQQKTLRTTFVTIMENSQAYSNLTQDKNAFKIVGKLCYIFTCSYPILSPPQVLS